LRFAVNQIYAALAAAKGREGWKMAAANQVDWVLLDLKRPGRKGRETPRPLAVLQKPLDFPMLSETIRKWPAQAGP
jgi:DNA-binding NarL/FixJ family response regulator